MKKTSRRDFILACSSGLTIGVLARIEAANAQLSNMAFWKSQAVVPPEVRTSQVIARSVILDRSLKVRTSHIAARTVILDRSLQVRTSQVVARTVAIDRTMSISTSQVILKVAAKA